MPFYNVSTHALLIEAENPTEAAMMAYKLLEDRTPSQFEVAGPDDEINHVFLDEGAQKEALTIDFGKRHVRVSKLKSIDEIQGQNPGQVASEPDTGYIAAER